MHLFALGSNGSGQLGIGHTEDVSSPTECVFETSEQYHDPLDENDNIIRVVAGGNHTLLLTAKGGVWAAGWNGDGRCGENITCTHAQGQDWHRDGEENGPPTANEKKIPNTATRQEQGQERDDHEEEGPLLRFRRVRVHDPVSGLTVEHFKHIAATWEGSLLVASVPKISKKNSLFSSEQINRRADDQSVSPEEEEDRIYVLGTGTKGELGTGAQTLHSRASAPSYITNFPPSPYPSGQESTPKITALATGMAHTIAILSNGQVYGWGSSRKGQLGPGNKAAKIIWEPTRVDGIPFFARGAVCGREFTVVWGDDCRRFVLLGDRGMRWGVLGDSLSSSSELSASSSSPHGDGKDEGVVEVTAVNGFTDIFASWNGVYVHAPPNPTGISTSEGDITTIPPRPGHLIAWGRNDRGQHPPPNLPPPAMLAVGSEHVLALLEDGTVAAFGWGEHGNCGSETDARGNVAGTYNVMSLPADARTAGGRVVGVGVGCATSWLIVS
ncbi:Regulator of chromosome condensation RCC1 [Penicillium lagena]|uniref:Regulator of chromosome condensation RCC1 n=1 Tax=Penicillium lagena TaxID=94218 RepID=UPI002541E54B|nr:Regulator of chromosome condensation RCC1 [Penicillium lagena]KAJ5604736.1 Regulator of chromosome condensation RCC1 [Penicillium lagena]